MISPMKALYQMINPRRKLYWVEPYDESGKEHVIVWCTVTEAIEWEKAIAARVKPGFVYGSAREALMDFIGTHWATYSVKSWQPAPLIHMKERLKQNG